MKKIIVVGSSNTDLVISCDRLPEPGETVSGGEFARFSGGKGANQAVAAARAGAHVTFIGAYGDDDFGRAAKAGLKREGIDVRHFRAHAEASSGVALILIGGRERQNLIAVARSANDRVTPAAVNKARPAFCSAAAVVAQLEIPIEAVQAAAEHARNQGVPFILNPAPATRLPASLLRLVHTLTPNEHEAELIAGVKGLSAAVRKLRQLGCLNVAVTLGARGALLASETSEHIIPGACVEPVDTVGAGDCFTAWLAVGLAEGMSLDDAAKRACHAAAISVTRPGAQASMPFRSEVPA